MNSGTIVIILLMSYGLFITYLYYNQYIDQEKYLRARMSYINNKTKELEEREQELNRYERNYNEIMEELKSRFSNSCY